MELYKKGQVVLIGKNYIVLETALIGQIIYVARVNEFKNGDKIKVFVFRYQNDYSDAWYGFLTFEERSLFQNLISVSGVGPKTALAILCEGVKGAKELIGSGDTIGLASYPFIGQKTASQLVFELQDKYQGQNLKNIHKVSRREVGDSLKTLGFSKEQVSYALDKVDFKEPPAKQIEQAIRLIASAKFA